MSNGCTELQRDAILREYQFVSSLIPMYRGFQMQAVGFAMVIYAALLTLWGASMNGQAPVHEVVRYSAGAAPFFIALLVVSFGVMELRVRRANLYIGYTLSPIATAMGGELPIKGALIFGFGIGHAKHLTPFEKRLSNSLILVLTMAAPAAAGAGWLLTFDAPFDQGWRIIGLGGLLVLVLAAGFAILVSSRDAPVKDTPAAGTNNRTG